MKPYINIVSAVIVLAALLYVASTQEVKLQKIDISEQIIAPPTQVNITEAQNFTVNYTEIPAVTKAVEEQRNATPILTPKTVQFSVNRYPIPENQPMMFVPIRKDQMRIISGTFGPYEENIREYVWVYLCSSELNEGYKKCERIVPNYRNNYLEFTRGYTDEEYIAGVARAQFLTWYEIHSHDGMLAKSNTARVEIAG